MVGDRQATQPPLAGCAWAGASARRRAELIDYRTGKPGEVVLRLAIVMAAQVANNDIPVVHARNVHARGEQIRGARTSRRAVK